MSQKNPTNIAASIRQRLLNKARIENRPFNELIQYYAMERFLYRFSLSKYSDKFILKGALLFRVWNSDTYRPTKDIDMLGKTDNNESNISTIIREVLSIQVEPDGMNYDKKSLTTDKITEDADYEGIRVSFNGTLDTARVYIQIDIGFGDVVYPKPEKEELPCILDSPAPSLLCYSRESAIAEKFETMIKMKEINSRMKDFYDIWLLSRQYAFDLHKLAKAISSTFAKRETFLPEKITAFSEEFAKLKQVQWKAFKNKQASPEMPDSFLEVVNDISHFLNPIIQKIRSDIKSS